MATQNGQNEQDGQDGTAFPLGPHAPSGHAIPPPGTPLVGQTTALVPLQPAHAPALYKQLGGEENAWRWTYMLSGGYPTFPEFEAAVAAWSKSADPDYYAVLSGPDASAAEAVGLVGYLAVVPQMRRLEIGCVILGGSLTRSRQATEAFYLFIRHAFDDLGYTRVEWKANKLNAPSLRAAERMGFQFEGVFRKHMIIKGRFRDTAWLSMTDDEWPVVKRGFEAWLDDSNFDENGKQRRGLKECREGGSQS